MVESLLQHWNGVSEVEYTIRLAEGTLKKVNLEH